MSVKVTEEALRQFIRKKLSEQSELSGESSPVDMQDVPLEAEDVVQDFDVDLGPPVADPTYMPENIDELKSAVGKLLDDVPESATKTAYKIIKKSLDNLHSVLRQRSEIMPSTALSESSPVERLLLLISEQYGGSYEMSDPSMSSEEEGEAKAPGVRSRTYDDREVSPPSPKSTEAEDQRSQFDRFFKKKMKDMLALAKARHPNRLQDVNDWNDVDNALSPEEHLAIMDAYDDALAKKYPSLARARGKDFEPPVSATLVAAVEAFMKDQDLQVSDDTDSETSQRTVSPVSDPRGLEDVDLGLKSSQDQAAKEGLRRELYRMSVGSKEYYDNIIDIVMMPDSVGDAKLKKSVEIALKDYAEEEQMPETEADYFEFVVYMNQDLNPDIKKNYRTSVLARAAEHAMSQAGFAGSKGGAQRPHINKESTLSNVMAAVDGIKSRSDRSDAESLESLSDILNKMLPKGETVPVINIRDDEPDEEPEEKTAIARSPGGKTFRRKKPGDEAELSENLTPADAILKSSAVFPDIKRALRLSRG